MSYLDKFVGIEPHVPAISANPANPPKKEVCFSSFSNFSGYMQDSPDTNSEQGIATIARESAAVMLKKVAEDIRWPLFDLLDWYKSDQDMTDIAGLPFDKVKALVNEYLAHIDTLRGKNHHLTHMRLDPYYTIACRPCQHWTADEIGAYGIGDCSIHSVPVPPAYPDAKRRCFEYKLRL